MTSAAHPNGKSPDKPVVSFSQSQFFSGLLALVCLIGGGFGYLVHNIYESMDKNVEDSVREGGKFEAFLTLNLPIMQSSIDKLSTSTTRLDAATTRLETAVQGINTNINELKSGFQSLNANIMEIRSDFRFLNRSDDDLRARLGEIARSLKVPPHRNGERPNGPPE